MTHSSRSKWLSLLIALAGCKAAHPNAVDASVGRTVAAPGSARLEPLEPVGDDSGVEQYFKVKPFTPVGRPVPADAVKVTVSGETHSWNGRDLKVLLGGVDDTYLAQAADLLSKLDDAHAEVWLKHPDAELAYEVVLRDEPAFQGWLDEPVAGKLRVIHRADGFELQTNLGKLPGPDINGPTVPVRGGKLDLATLQRGLEKIAGRFKGAPDLCFVPSFGMALNDTVRAVATNFVGADTAHFSATCLVYPRPRAGTAAPGSKPSDAGQ